MNSNSTIERFVTDCVSGHSRPVCRLTDVSFWEKSFLGQYGDLATVLRQATRKEQLCRHIASRVSTSYTAVMVRTH